MVENNEQILTVTDRKTACITGVSEVDGVTSERIIFTLIGDKRVIITGSSLKMTGFSKQTTTLTISGTINEIKYSGEKNNFLKRLIK